MLELQSLLMMLGFPRDYLALLAGCAVCLPTERREMAAMLSQMFFDLDIHLHRRMDHPQSLFPPSCENAWSILGSSLAG